jgi:O-antigen/teichoic acid export membrane protein
VSTVGYSPHRRQWLTWSLSGHLWSYLILWVGWGATAGAEVLLLPVLSRLLTAGEYGRYLLIYGIVLFLSDAAAVWASTAFVRFASHSDRATAPQTKETLLAAVVLLSILALLAELSVAGVVAVVGNADLARAFVASAFLLPGLCVFTFALANYQASGRRVKYGALSIGRFVSMSVIGLLAVLTAQRSATAFLWGASAGVSLLVLPYLWKNLKPRPFSQDSRRVIREAFQFGLGMWFQYLAGKVLRVGDRFVVGAFIGAAAVGIYGAEYALLFGTVAIVVSPLITVITPRAYATADREGDSALATLIGKILSAYVPIIFLAVSGLFIVTPLVFGMLLPDRYSTALRPDIVLALEVAAALHGVTLIINMILGVKRRTLVSAKLFAILATANIAFNLVMVPAFGISGAVYANLLSYAALLGFTIVWCRRFVPISLPVKAGVIALSGIAALVVVANLTSEMTWWTATALETLTVLFVMFALVAVTPAQIILRSRRAMRGPEQSRVQIAI